MKKSFGLTLMEVLVVLAITSTLMLTSLYGIKTMQRHLHRHQAILKIKSMIHYAKNQAVLLRTPLTIEPLKLNCWSCGMRLVDPHASNHQTIYIWTLAYPDLQVSWHGFQSDDYLRIAPEISQLALNGYFLLEGASSLSQKIVLNRFGHIRVQ